MDNDPQSEDDFSDITPIARGASSAAHTARGEAKGISGMLGLGLGLLVLIVIGLLSFRFLPQWVEPVVIKVPAKPVIDPSEVTPIKEVAKAVEVVEEKDNPQRDAALKARASYDHALRAWDDVQAPTWSPVAYTAGVHQATLGEAALDARAYEEAERLYLAAKTGLEEVKVEIPEVVGGLIQKGRVAVEAGDQATAVAAFELALLIDPENKVAKAGLIRARVAAELWKTMQRAQGHEAEKAWALAQTDYALAVNLDPASNAARAGLNRMRAQLTEEAFQERISEGLSLFHQEKYDEAVAVLSQALEFKPESKEGLEALALAKAKVEELRLLAIEEQALALENASQWSTALKLYAEAMKIDRDVVFAREGTKRAQQHLEMTQKVESLVAHPDRLLTEKGYQYASSLVVEFKTWEVQGSRLAKKITRLEEQMKVATAPVEVVITSDNQTRVDVYKVGRFGAFFKKELSLKPGKYTIVGSRPGYRDERQIVLIEPRKEPKPIVVVCAEKF